MKIGLVCPYNIAKGGGVQEAVRAMQTELKARGHRVKIITPEPRADGRFDRRGIIFLGSAADFRSPLSTTAQISTTIDVDELDAVLAREQFDILHFHEPWVPMLSRQILSRSTCVNIATFHAKLPENMMSRTISRVVTPYTKKILDYLHELTAVSSAAADYVSGLTERPVSIIPNGVDLKRFRVPRETSRLQSRRTAAGTDPDSWTILYIGRLERRKGVKYLLQAYAKLQARVDNVSLVIVGDGPDRRRLEEMTYNLGLRNVHFAGFVSEKEKIAYLQAADLFCSPAVYGESFGIVLLEAIASGVVTVAGNNPGYRDVMQGLGSISLVDPHDAAEFARRMELLLTERELRAMWQQWARAYVRRFSYKRIVDQYEKIYEHALREHAGMHTATAVKRPAKLVKEPAD